MQGLYIGFAESLSFLLLNMDADIITKKQLNDYLENYNVKVNNVLQSKLNNTLIIMKLHSILHNSTLFYIIILV